MLFYNFLNIFIQNKDIYVKVLSNYYILKKYLHIWSVRSGQSNMLQNKSMCANNPVHSNRNNYYK